MYDPVTGMDYERPRCAACTRELWDTETGRLVCRPCEERAAKQLRELARLFARLDSTAALVKGGRRAGASASGSKVPPLPLNITVLNLAAGGGVATRLQAIEDAWRQALGWSVAPRTDGLRTFASWRADPARDVPGQIKFLSNNLLWACSSYAEVAQDLEEIRRLHSEVSAALSAERRPGRVKVGHCPTRYDNGERCAHPLTATAANTRIHCPGCGARWDDMDAWRQLRREQEVMYAELTGVAA